jgi:hypothetical protein
VQIELLNQARQRLAFRPTYQSSSVAYNDPETLRTHLRMGRLHLPVMSAKHESRLLIEARDNVPIPGVPGLVVSMPPCMYGAACVGRDNPPVIPELTEPVTFMRAMTEEEYTALVRTGAQPTSGPRPCVLCHRYKTVCYAYRFHRVRSTLPPSARIEHEQPGEVLQLWCNLVDQADGYWKDFIYQPSDGEILVSPIVFGFSHLRAYKKPATTPGAMTTSLWRVDQSALMWAAPAMPEARTGEPLRNFCEGAGSTSSSTTTTVCAPPSCVPRSRPLPPPAAACSTPSLSLSRH